MTDPVCQPTIRGHRSGPWDRRYGAGPWIYNMKCYDHDTSWMFKNRGTWQDALDLAAEHHQERTLGRFGQP